MKRIADPTQRRTLKQIVLGLVLGAMAFGVAACDGEEGVPPAPGDGGEPTSPPTPPTE